MGHFCDTVYICHAVEMLAASLSRNITPLYVGNSRRRRCCCCGCLAPVRVTYRHGDDAPAPSNRLFTAGVVKS